MFELTGVNYEEVLEQGDSILVRVIASSSYWGFELSGLYCTYLCVLDKVFPYLTLKNLFTSPGIMCNCAWTCSARRVQELYKHAIWKVQVQIIEYLSRGRG